MNLFPILILSLLGYTVVNSVVVRKKVERKESSSSSSSEDRPPRRRQKTRYYSEEKPRPRPLRPPVRDPPARGCESGWMTFNRPQGTWCVKVFQVGGANRETAELLCKGHGATLTGVQDANENMQIAADAVRAFNLNPVGQGEVWLGATRKPNCPLKQSCGPLETFDWTDGHTTGNYFFWGPSEPNGIIWTNWGQQNCITQLVSNCCPKAKFGYPHGSMDDSHCQNSFNLYACGKRPS